jgi:palmitoyltransferase ZDHHC3/7/25
MVLLGWHVYLILHNKTTIEVWKIGSLVPVNIIVCRFSNVVVVCGVLQYHEGVRAMWLAEKTGNLYRNPYDLGIYENIVSVRTTFTCFCWHNISFRGLTKALTIEVYGCIWPVSFFYLFVFAYARGL